MSAHIDALTPPVGAGEAAAVAIVVYRSKRCEMSLVNTVHIPPNVSGTLI